MRAKTSIIILALMAWVFHNDVDAQEGDDPGPQPAGLDRPFCE